MADRLLQTVSLSFFVKKVIYVAHHTLSGRLFQILGASKAKLWPKCLADLQNEDQKGGNAQLHAIALLYSV